MKRIFVGILSIATLLVSSCGSPSVKRKLRVEYYSILDDLRVSCTLIGEDYNTFNWVGFIHYWFVVNTTRETFWYELSGGEYALKVGTRQ